jgi:hypothetical protein
VLRCFDRLFFALEVERQLAGVVLLESVVHERVIDPGLGVQPF